MEASRSQVLMGVQSMIQVEQELPHHHCFCYHCTNNTKPIVQPLAPRIVSHKQKKLTNTKAYELLLKEMSKGYVGKCLSPDVYFLSDASLICQARNGRSRLRQKMTHMEVKKHFEEQRKRGLGLSASLLLATSFFSIPEEGISSAQNTSKAALKEKQSSVLAYHDGTEQLLTDSLLGKYLGKRKNDPIWQGVSHLMLIPPQCKHPIKKHRYHYIRSQDTLPLLQPLTQKLAKEIDAIEQNNLVTGQSARQMSKLSSLRGEEEEQMELSMNPQLNRTSIGQRKVKSMIIPKKNSSFYVEEIKFENTRDICLEIVAYMEVTTYTRILQCDFQYFSDGTKMFLTSISNFISQQLEGGELTFVHDRYKPLEEIGLGEIAIAKTFYDAIQEAEVHKICANLVKESMEFRKVELKLENYRNPSEEVLLQIFMKIFPEFDISKVICGVNWKNELGVFITDTKKKINQVIRQDEGIRILRRFGFEFRRTFH